MPLLTGEDNLLPMNKSITAELQEQWAILNEVWGTPMAQWKGVAVAAWMEAAIGKLRNLKSVIYLVLVQECMFVINISICHE